VRAEFYLGLLNALVAHSSLDAETHFKECKKRLERDKDLLSGVRMANYIATLNNLAIVEVRLHKYNEAVGLWRKALAIAPYTPELVQNLGLMTVVAYLPKDVRTTAANLDVKIVVDNSLGRFDDHVGWLYIPYIDTFDGSMDSEGDEEMVTVAWCTGFSLGGDYVLTSRYPMADADRVVVHDGGNTFEVPIGKVVAISDQSNLALLKIDGLNGNAFPLSSATPRPLQSYTMIGYREPGFTGETFQTMTANIVDTPNVLRHVDTAIIHDRDVSQCVHWFNYRDMLMHDAVTNAGMAGSPLLDQQGKVVGVHLGNPPSFGTYGSKFALAEPAHYAIQFLKPLAPDLDLSEPEVDGDKLLSPHEIQQRARRSIYQLAIQKKAPRLEWSHRIEELNRLQKQGTWASYEDRVCMLCNGTKQLKCPNRGCAGGTIPKKVQYVVSKNTVTGEDIYGTRTEREKCPVCDGRGWVACDNCDGKGIDKMFAGK
jgi:S1-C subfamily serine protease